MRESFRTIIAMVLVLSEKQLSTLTYIKLIIANITGILYTLKQVLRVIIENLRAEISFAAHSV